MAGESTGDIIDVYIGKKLRQQRGRRNVTQDYVAAQVGVRFQQIQKYECGANRISASRLWKIALALDVPVSYFYEGLPEYLSGLEKAASQPSQEASHKGNE